MNTFYHGTKRGEFVHKRDFDPITIIVPDEENGEFRMGESAFAHSNLDKVVIGDFNNIGDWAFQSCSNLSQVIFSPEIREIGEGAFADCTNLRQIILPENLKRIGKGAFKGCKALKEVIFYDALKVIEEKAFMNCVALESVILPKSVEVLGNYVFANCTRLHDFDFNNRSIAFKRNQKRNILQIGKALFVGCNPKIKGFTPYLTKRKKDGSVKFQRVPKGYFEKYLFEENVENTFFKLWHNMDTPDTVMQIRNSEEELAEGIIDDVMEADFKIGSIITEDENADQQLRKCKVRKRSITEDDDNNP